MSKSIMKYMYEEEELLEDEKCPGIGSGSRKGLMRKKFGTGLGPQDGKGSSKGRAGRFRKLRDKELEDNV